MQKVLSVGQVILELLAAKNIPYSLCVSFFFSFAKSHRHKQGICCHVLGVGCGCDSSMTSILPESLRSHLE